MAPSHDLTVPADAAATHLVEKGAVLVDGRPGTKSMRLRGGEGVRVSLLQEPPPAEIAVEPRIVWEGEAVIVIDKPAGLVVHPAPGHRGVTLVEWLAAGVAAAAWEPHAVHRLDRDTSGLMLVAKG